MGAVQGVTEWFPVSSSGHLVFFQHILDINPGVAFSALVHFASFLVILAVFWKDILRLAMSPFLPHLKKSRQLLLALIVGSIPAAFFGLLFKNQIEALFSGFAQLAWAFIFTGIVLLLSRSRLFKGIKMSIPVALAIGFAQAIALVPGISRSGMTISVALILGIARKDAARFSFLLALPALLGAFLLEAPKLLQIGSLLGAFLGFVAAMVVGFVSLRLLMRNIQRIHWFSIWCFVMAILVFVLSL